MSLTPAWIDSVRMVRNGDPVDAAATNRAPTDLKQRDDYLKARIDALAAGVALRIREASITPAVHGGAAVFYDENAGPAFGPAQAKIDFNTGSVGAISTSSYVVGVVERKLSSSVADLVTAGCVVYTDTTMLEDPAVSGPRYLSMSTPGMLVRVKPTFAIYVGFWMAEWSTMVVSPEMKDTIDSHTHYKFQLYTTPAGTPNTPGYMEKVQIITPNPSVPGWLPANDPVFGGSAPEGAKFGYNLAKHPDLFSVFPPVPISSSYIDVYLDGQGAGREFDRVAVIDNSGIWWMRDDWGWGPWEIDTASVPLIVPPDPPGTPPPTTLMHGHGYTGAGKQCPMSMTLWFSRPTYFNENSVVTSLTPKDGSSITVTDCSGKPAHSGALIIDVNLGLTDDGINYPGYRVVKEITSSQVKLGNVLEGIKSNSSILTVVPEAGVLPDGDGYYPGRVTLNYNDPSLASREFDVALFALDKAEQAVDQDIYYISFNPNISSSVRGRIDVPAVGVPSGTFPLTVRLRLICTLAGALPALTMTYRRMAQAPMQTPGVMPGQSSEVSLPSLNLALANGGAPTGTSNMYFDISSAPMTVVAGDSVFFTLRRNIDSYPGKIGIIRSRGVIGG